MDRSTDSRRARNSDSVTIGGRRRPVSRPSRRRCFLASSLVEPLTERTSSLPFGSRTCTTVSGGSSEAGDVRPGRAGRTAAALAAPPARAAARGLGVGLGRTARRRRPRRRPRPDRRGRVGGPAGRRLRRRRWLAGPAAAGAGGRPPGSLRLRLAAVSGVRLAVLGSLARPGPLGSGWPSPASAAASWSPFLAAAAARPPPAAPSRAGAVVIVAGAPGRLGAPADPAGPALVPA